MSAKIILLLVAVNLLAQWVHCSEEATIPVIGLTVRNLVTDYKCIKKNFLTFLAIEGFTYQQVNPLALQIISQTYSQNLDVDLIIKPCAIYEDPIVQAKLIAKTFDRHKIKKTWIKVNEESDGYCQWIDADTNCAYLFNFMNYLEIQGFSTGIFSSQQQWTKVFGTSNACTRLSNKPLWYINNNGATNMTDYSTQKFGGWEIPLQKQYQQNQTICGLQVDQVYHTYYALQE